MEFSLHELIQILEHLRERIVNGDAEAVRMLEKYEELVFDFDV